MLTLCSEICHSKAQSKAETVQASSTAAQPQQAGRADSGGAKAKTEGSKVRQPRASVGAIVPEASSIIAGGGGGVGLDLDSQGASKNWASADRKAGINGASSAPGLFGVMRQPSTNNLMQTQLKKEVSSRTEDLARATEEDKQRARLIVALEREVFEKEQRVLELNSSIKQIGDEASAELGGSAAELFQASGEPLSASNKEKLLQEIRAREAEAQELGGRLKSLEESIQDKRAEVVAKGEATLKLLFELSRNAEQQRMKGATATNPLLQAAPVVSESDDAVQPL
mmetsp:Transcript_75621/g.130947  ORF Transcript_75621/g.130947 Transcript_75621/m.130947 type:complete len:284 (-) Transcript_75621:40-891(-)